MSSIKVNYNGRKQRTSTTFTETMARFFIRAWYGMQRLLEEVGEHFAIRDKQDLFYRDIDAVKKTFQECINHMTVYIDAIHEKEGYTYTEGWSKVELEHYMLTFIRAQAQGEYLDGELVSWD